MKVITAEEFLLKNNDYIDIATDYPKLHEEIQESMIEFAKFHVQAALEAALESIPCLGSSSDIATYEEVEQAVLNCYPENLIK